MWYADADADGFGDDTNTTTACEAPTSFVAQGGDCDDGDKHRPSRRRRQRREGLDKTATVPSTRTQTSWFADADVDGHGDATEPAFEEACDPPGGLRLVQR
ncbi:MAG: hypothetical protein IPI35_25920 [Deltaproteobacteria bacterium]|nr:hypothetical protein [Deltaproteobacteria bacterium]